jgi:hypothetical protein
MNICRAVDLGFNRERVLCSGGIKLSTQLLRVLKFKNPDGIHSPKIVQAGPVARIGV